MGHEHSTDKVDINFSDFRMMSHYSMSYYRIICEWVWKVSRSNESSLGTCLDGLRHSTKICVIIGASPEIRITGPFPNPTHHHNIQFQKSRLRKFCTDYVGCLEEALLILPSDVETKTSMHKYRLMYNLLL